MTWHETIERIKEFLGDHLVWNVACKWGILRVLISLLACLVWTLGFLIFIIVLSKYKYTQEIGYFPLMLSILITTGVFYILLFWRRK